ncbi:putative reverse transcriptase domain-containing protein [Tanacetum coccineum]
MQPRRFKKKSVRKTVEKRVAKAIEKYEKTRADSNNAGGSRSTNTGGTVVPEMHGCSNKDIYEWQAPLFQRDECVVRTETFGSKRWSKNVQTLGLANGNQILWSNVKATMTTEYCPATEIQRMEQELWTLTLKGDDIEAYNNRFHELALMCHELVPTEKKKIERYVRVFPERIKGNITSSKPATLHDAIIMARELSRKQFRVGLQELVKAIRGNGKTTKETPTTITTTTTITATKTTIITSKKTGDRKMSGHMLSPSWRKDLCWKFTKMQPVQLTSSWTMSSNVPEMSKNRSRAEKSFVSSVFTHFIDIAPATLNTSYEIKLVDGKVVSTNIILRSCTLIVYPLPNGKIPLKFKRESGKSCHSLACIKADEKKLDDIRVVRDFPEISIPVSPLEMLELLNQLKELQEKGFIRPSHSPWGAPSEEEHEVHLKTILDLLEKEKLYAKFSKCEFWLKEVQFLGHVVNRDGIHVDPSKVESVKNWKTPESSTEIRSFLGFASYVWGDKQDEAFQILKEKLCNAPVLALPDGPDDFVVYLDCNQTMIFGSADAAGQSDSICVKTVEEA